MTKKISLLIASLIMSTSAVFAGGVLTNTNQSARFIRLVAMDATTTVDGAYYNPAGLSLLPHDGFHFSFSNQSAFQKRIITTTYEPFKGFGGEGTKQFVGEASAPIVPSLQAAYKKGNWVLSGNLAITGGGGKATFNNGLPSFEAMLGVLPLAITAAGADIPPTYGKLSAQGYSVDQYMSGSSYIFGAQLGGTYKINDMFSVYAGFRLNIVNNKYEGYLRDLKVGITSQNLEALGIPIPNNNGSLTNPESFLNFAIAKAQAGEQTAESAELIKSLELAKLATTQDGARLNSKQSGWGISPIFGFNFNYKKLNVGIKYEFKTSLNVENKTKIDDTGMFNDGVNVAHDIPALLTVGASYEVFPKLTLNVGYHRFFDTDSDVESSNNSIKFDKNRYITGTDEYLFGAEYKINDIFLISAGGQVTRYDLDDKFQSDLSFSLNSYSIGFGGAAKVAKNVLINVGYFWTEYSDHSIGYDNYNAKYPIPGKSVYSRTNKVFAAGVEFSF